MTLREKIECMEAFERGEEIELKNCDNEWNVYDSPSWDWINNKYRIKPKPKQTVTIERVISELRLLDKELEALQQPKSCEGCKHYKFTYNSNDGAVRQLMTICSDCFRRLNRDNYEPKE